MVTAHCGGHSWLPQAQSQAPCRYSGYHLESLGQSIASPCTTLQKKELVTELHSGQVQGFQLPAEPYLQWDISQRSLKIWGLKSGLFQVVVGSSISLIMLPWSRDPCKALDSQELWNHLFWDLFYLIPNQIFLAIQKKRLFITWYLWLAIGETVHILNALALF